MRRRKHSHMLLREYKVLKKSFADYLGLFATLVIRSEHRLGQKHALEALLHDPSTSTRTTACLCARNAASQHRHSAASYNKRSRPRPQHKRQSRAVYSRSQQFRARHHRRGHRIGFTRRNDRRQWRERNAVVSNHRDRARSGGRDDIYRTTPRRQSDFDLQQPKSRWPDPTPLFETIRFRTYASSIGERLQQYKHFAGCSSVQSTQ